MGFQMMDWSWSRREKILAGAFVGVLLLWAVSMIWGKKESDPLENALKNVAQQEKNIPSSQEDTKTRDVWVDVKGAVHKPGIYKAKPDTRVFQAIEDAGGILSNADTNQMNLAQPITDGMVLYVPKHGEKVPTFMAQAQGNANSFASSDSSGKVNINTATEEELQSLPGIGPSKAKAIVQYRTEHGSFSSVEDLKNISGLGEKTIARFKDKIAVG